ncbi:DNA photolyase family protein [Alphaproteobacteria bacterium]|nr:DNA photolyase family protein [Alphaproteobacteria bacterium]
MKPIIVWFRQDLRLSDNLALSAAAATGRPIIALYVFEGSNRTIWSIGKASKVWLHLSLQNLDSSLKKIGGRLTLRDGQPGAVLAQLIAETGANSIFWNRCYEPASIKRDAAIKSDLKNFGLEIQSFNGALLYEPWVPRTKTGTPFKVFTPFWKSLLAGGAPEEPISLPTNLTFYSTFDDNSLDDLRLLPSKPDWSKTIQASWSPGESNGKHQLHLFLDHGLKGYADLRDRPDLSHCSALSPFLHFGEISPRQIWQATTSQMATVGNGSLDRDGWAFLREIAWREFSYHLLFHFPELPDVAWNKKFHSFAWIEDQSHLVSWQTGQTGYPIVDAGMRQLWHTGWMHNRVRMVAASFLTKHLLQHWSKGEKWFWETLVDADLASNAASWQWIAGCGFDASPYFRIFNPIIQGQKFDPKGDYVKQWVPELANLPTKYLHAPWEAPPHILADSNITLGGTYPQPIVDHKSARLRALDTYKKTMT